MVTDASLPTSARLNWAFVRQLSKGGQAHPIVVRRRADEAVGVLKTPLLRRKSARERFERETRIVEGLDHLNIAPLLESDVVGDQPWYVTPLGDPLKAHWASVREKPFSATQTYDAAVPIIEGVLDGLASVHAAGIVHRDIKPANIIMFGRRPVIIDFGIAFEADAERLTDMDDPVGNRHGGPPEASYGFVEEPSPWWDCLQTAWLWAWMLECGPPKFGKHWKYHRFLDDNRCEKVRAVLAACSSEGTAPRNATEMLTLARTLGLLGGSRTQNEPHVDGRLTDAVTRYQHTLSKHRVRAAELEERREATVPLAAEVLYTVIEQLAALAADVGRHLPVTVAYHRDLRASVRAAMATDGGSNRSFEIHLRTTPESYIDLDVVHRIVDDDVLPLIARLRTRDRPKRDVVHFCIALDGTLRKWSGENPHHDEANSDSVTDVETLVAEVRDWITDPSAW